MLYSFPILFTALVAIPGLLIPLHLSPRMYRVLVDAQRPRPEKVVAGAGLMGMVLLMCLAVYLAQETFVRLNSIAGMSL